MKGLWRLAAVSAPALALVACDSGYKAGYYEGFSLGYETKGSEKAEKQQASAEPVDAIPLVLATPAPVEVAAIAPAKTPAANPVRAKPKASVAKVQPVTRSAAASTAKQERPAAVEPVQTAAAGKPAQPSPAAKPQPAVAPFAPLRPGASGGGIIIRVGNNTVKPEDDDKPDDDKPDDGDAGDGHKPGHGKPGGGHKKDAEDSPPPPSAAPPPPAKITIVDTSLGGTAGKNQLVGVGLGSPSPVQPQLISASVLPADGRSLASISLGATTISVGNAPIVGGGIAPLVSVSALPDLGVVTKIISPVTGALIGTGGSGGTTASSGGGAATNAAAVVSAVTAPVAPVVSAVTAPIAPVITAVTTAVPVVPIVTGAVTNVGNTATGLVGGLLGGGKH